MVIILSESVAMAPDFYVLVLFRPVFPIWVQFSRYIGICVELELILAIFAKKSSSFLGSHEICFGLQIEKLVGFVLKVPPFSVNFKGIVNSSKTVEKTVSGKPVSLICELRKIRIFGLLGCPERSRGAFFPNFFFGVKRT